MTPMIPIAPLSEHDEQRLWGKVALPDENGCMLWLRSTWKGYGRMLASGKRVYVHRLVYTHLVGPIPDGMVLDHLCRVRQCVAPRHLEPVTSAENTRRSPIHNGAKTHCPQGHPYDEVNTYRTPGGVGRYCRTCTAARGS